MQPVVALVIEVEAIGFHPLEPIPLGAHRFVDGQKWDVRSWHASARQAS